MSAEKYEEVAVKLKSTMEKLSELAKLSCKENPNPETSELVGVFLETCLEYGLTFEKNSSGLPSTVLLDFSTQNKQVALDIRSLVPNYLLILSSKLSYHYEDPDEEECVLADACTKRSGLEYFLDIFEPRFQEENEKECNAWYLSLDLDNFDKILKTKVKNKPILQRYRLPKNIPNSHWWWTNSDD